MIFHSTIFFFFFILYFILHLSIPIERRLIFIIIGSTIFYAYWNPYYIWVPYLLTLLSYQGAIWIDKPALLNKKWRMASVICVLLLPLAIVKYSHFLYNEVLRPLLGLNALDLKLPLPLGLSFITFTAIAYVIDVYRQRFPVERRFSMLSALFLFFPHLIAGPILRPSDLLPRLDKPRSAKKSLQIRWTFAIVLFSLGLVKKLVFADSLGECVDYVYSTSDSISGWSYLLAIYGFSVQIYCDFSGYTDMAIALAILLGVRLPDNFHHPYNATSIIDFWRKWHITLSNWLRDYVYFSLGGNRAGYIRQGVNILITMTLGGLWHGANWTFMAWGTLQGMAIASVHGLRRVGLIKFLSLPRWFCIFLTFQFVTFSWILFRAPTLEIAWKIMRGPFLAPYNDIPIFLSEHAFLLSLLALFLLTHRFDSHRIIRRAVRRLYPGFLWTGVAIAWLLAMSMSMTSSEKFIYYDF